MSPCGTHSAAWQAPVFESDREKFFRILLHDDRNSFYILSSDASGSWSDTALKANGIAAYQFNMVSNYYITHNGFAGKRRLSVNTRQLNSIFFDIDCHNSPAEECGQLVNQILSRVNAAVEASVLPEPTMVVDSGRGVHLYYVLNRSIPYQPNGQGQVNEPGISFFQRVQEQLADILNEVLADVEGASVDRAVFDHARVSRVPDTYNTKAGKRARLVSASEVFHSLSSLYAFKPRNPRKTSVSANKHKRPASVLKFDRLLMARLSKIIELQAYRKYNCEGSRELMCFVFYNTAVQVYTKEDAWNRLVAFNAQFNDPVPHKELEGILRAVSEVTNVKGEKGYYVLKADTLVRLLSLTEQEIRDTNFFTSKRALTRMEAKRKTKEKRDARNDRILNLYSSDTMTQQQVAKAVGCSLRTVQMVLKSAGMTRRYVSRNAKQKASGHTMDLRKAARLALTKLTLNAASKVVPAQAAGGVHAPQCAENCHTGFKSSVPRCFEAFQIGLSFGLFRIFALPPEFKRIYVLNSS